MTRMSCDQRTQAYACRRTAEGLSKREILRCLKRYIARDVFRALPEATTLDRTQEHLQTPNLNTNRQFQGWL